MSNGNDNDDCPLCAGIQPREPEKSASAPKPGDTRDRRAMVPRGSYDIKAGDRFWACRVNPDHFFVDGRNWELHIASHSGNTIGNPEYHYLPADTPALTPSDPDWREWWKAGEKAETTETAEVASEPDPAPVEMPRFESEWEIKALIKMLRDHAKSFRRNDTLSNEDLMRLMSPVVARIADLETTLAALSAAAPGKGE